MGRQGFREILLLLFFSISKTFSGDKSLLWTFYLFI